MHTEYKSPELDTSRLVKGMTQRAPPALSTINMPDRNLDIAVLTVFNIIFDWKHTEYKSPELDTSRLVKGMTQRAPPALSTINMPDRNLDIAVLTVFNIIFDWKHTEYKSPELDTSRLVKGMTQRAPPALSTINMPDRNFDILQ